MEWIGAKVDWIKKLNFLSTPIMYYEM